MAIIKTLLDHTPKFGKGCFLADNSVLIGDLEMGDNCSVWFSTVIRADVNKIKIGNNTNIQDCTCVHATYKTGPVNIGNNVTIGHNVTIHACTIEDGALIGMGSTLLDGCVVEEGAIVAAGSLVLSRTTIRKGELWGGVPAKYIKMAKPGMAESYAEHYAMYKQWYTNENQSK